MNKSTFFSGQPIFTQLLKFIPKDTIFRIARQYSADRYCKRFSTYEHLVTILYSVFNNCNSLREVTTGMLASEKRLSHLGIRYHPRRSTISDANTRRNEEVFREIYNCLFKRYAPFLSDSRKKSNASRLYIIDSTVISLFQEVLRTSGKIPVSGKKKGGIKVHSLIRSDQDVPSMVRITEAAANDSQFLKQVNLPKGSIIVFDRGYRDFTSLNRFSSEGITWVTRLNKLFTYTVIQQYQLSKDSSIIGDQQIQLGWRSGTRVTARLITLYDETSKEHYEFVTNNYRMSAATIASLYRKRWQIELLFKRMKQNYPLKYFLGDSENAIKIQVWCVHIADMLLKIVKKATKAKWSFSNLAAMVRIHLMTYIDLFAFLNSPEKALLKLFKKQEDNNYNQLLFIT
ncbi:MAG: IS4 family transposase [Ginsengibacter sp.]